MKPNWPTIASIAGGLVLGLGLGLLFAWVVRPVNYVDTAPVSLRADFKDQFRLSIAAAYAADGNLPRAQARLRQLGDIDPAATLMDQSRHAAGPGGSAQAALALAGLAQAIGPAASIAPSQTASATPTETGTPGPRISPTPARGTAATPRPSRTPQSTFTPRPSVTPTVTPGQPFAIVANETTCDETLQPGLLQVTVKDADGKPVAGAEIVIAWQGGQESFFTGLKPELGDGYADFVMQEGVVYSLQLAADSETAGNLSIPPCQKRDGSPYAGGISLEFQQP
jgi:hypothetical protein